jgi:AhpD family alkylhydroperoxidase
MPRLPVLEAEVAGPVPDANLFGTLAARPEIAAASADLLRAAISRGSVSTATKTLCAALVSAINFCEPALIAYRREARAAGVSVEVLNALWDFARSDLFSAAQKAALSAAVSLTREARALPDTIWNQLRAEYGDGEIVEILSVIAVVNALNRVSNALQTAITR